MRSFSQTYFSTRYWLFVIFAIGVPGFTNYGPTGHGIEHGLFTPQSILQIALSCCCAAFFFSTTLAGGKAVVARPVKYPFVPLILLVIVLVIASIASPKDNIFLSVFRIGEWVLAFALFLSIYTREPLQTAPRLAADLVAKICWLSIFIVWIVFVIDPSLAYESLEDVTGANQIRFGGSVIHPIRLGLMAATAFWHTFLFGSKRWKTIGCTFAFLTMILTYSRIPWLGFLLGLILYTFVRKSPLLRVGACLGASISIPVVYLYSDKFIKFLGRGMGASNLESLSDRTAIWAMAANAIERRPWIGYGYIDGVKNALIAVQQTTWGTPPHCHNELLQMVANGGVFAGVLTLWIYLRVGWNTVRQVFRSQEGLFLMLLFIQLLLFSTGGIILGGPVLDVGGLMVVCIVCSSELFLASIPVQRPSFAKERDRSEAQLEAV